MQQVGSMPAVICCQLAVELFPRIFISVYILAKTEKWARLDGEILRLRNWCIVLSASAGLCRTLNKTRRHYKSWVRYYLKECENYGAYHACSSLNAVNLPYCCALVSLFLFCWYCWLMRCCSIRASRFFCYRELMWLGKIVDYLPGLFHCVITFLLSRFIPVTVCYLSKSNLENDYQQTPETKVQVRNRWLFKFKW